ncbi:MAG: sigma-70 family RNA polymerase sigma factor [Bryobacteraceae bacterium]|nr:sigma-70 family RNA polymerase sigma factor [Bryobacteraceae bacterium]
MTAPTSAEADRHDFDAAYRRWDARLRRFAYRELETYNIPPSLFDVDDLVLETWATAARNHDRGGPICWRWLKMACASRLNDWWRSNRRLLGWKSIDSMHRRFASDNRAEPAELSASSWGESAAGDTDPGAWLVDADLAAQGWRETVILPDLGGVLTPIQQRILRLHLDGLSVRQIAAAVGSSRANIHRHIKNIHARVYTLQPDYVNWIAPLIRDLDPISDPRVREVYATDLAGPRTLYRKPLKHPIPYGDECPKRAAVVEALLHPTEVIEIRHAKPKAQPSTSSELLSPVA